MTLYRDDCVFCDERKIKAEVIDHLFGADGSLHFVFEPLEPVVPGHLLVVPSLHVQDAAEDPLVTAMAAGVSARVAARYRASNIITSVGVPATQSVFHLHWHVVPRRMGDGIGLPWTAQRQGIRKKDLEEWQPHAVDVARGELLQAMKDQTKREGEEVMRMALRKHGEGEVIPETDQQKTAAQNGGMTDEAREELREENEKADR